MKVYEAHVAVTGNPVTSIPMMKGDGYGILKVQGPKGEAALKHTTAIEENGT